MAIIDKIIGRTVKSVIQDDDSITMNFADGAKAWFWHCQECCESVWVEDVNGDWFTAPVTPEVTP